MYFLGVDGGGTKTQVIIADEKSNILGKSLVGPTYIRSLTEDEITSTLEDGITKAFKNTGLGDLQISKSCYGISGLDNPSDFKNFHKYLRPVANIKLDPYPVILNDAVCALRGGTDRGFGISLVAGTGSNCYGKSRFGSDCFVGGLGHILSDEGGGYYIGTRVLHAASKSYDGRIPKSILEDLVYEFLEFST